jgi:hypothetical protein
MANTIKIKRSTATATPTSLAEGELAYSEQSGNLFVGTSGNNLTVIGGTDVQAIDSKADSSHSHNEYAASGHTHSGYAATAHTHSGYSASGHTHSEYADASHSHSAYADSSHTHSEYAASSHAHSGYATTSHSHSEYAASSHTHGDATPTVAGLMSATDKTNHNTMYALFNEDGASNVIDTVQEIIAAFEDHPEGLNLITELDAKLSGSSTIDGGSF